MSLELDYNCSNIALAPSELSQLRDTFIDQNYLRFQKLISNDVLSEVQESLQKEKFSNFEQGDIGAEDALRNGAGFDLLTFIFNNRNLFQLMSEITGKDNLKFFNGRIYQLVRDKEHFDSWHDDIDGTRMLALSINLNFDTKDESELWLRDRRTQEIKKIKNPNPGDAVLFNLEDYLEHQVVLDPSTSKRTVFAGWFQTSPDFWELSLARLNLPN